MFFPFWYFEAGSPNLGILKSGEDYLEFNIFKNS